MRANRNVVTDLTRDPDSWDEQTIANVLETYDPATWRVLARAVHGAPMSPLARRVAAVARECDVTGTGNMWLLLLRRWGANQAMTQLPERRHEQHWP